MKQPSVLLFFYKRYPRGDHGKNNPELGFKYLNLGKVETEACTLSLTVAGLISAW
jgi:hypothetical protein